MSPSRIAHRGSHSGLPISAPVLSDSRSTPVHLPPPPAADRFEPGHGHGTRRWALGCLDELPCRLLQNTGLTAILSGQGINDPRGGELMLRLICATVLSATSWARVFEPLERVFPHITTHTHSHMGDLRLSRIVLSQTQKSDSEASF